LLGKKDGLKGTSCGKKPKRSGGEVPKTSKKGGGRCPLFWVGRIASTGERNLMQRPLKKNERTGGVLEKGKVWRRYRVGKGEKKKVLRGHFGVG